MYSCPQCKTPQSWRQLIRIAATSSGHCPGCGKNLKLSRVSRTIGIVCGVVAGCVVGHSLRTAPLALNLTAIVLTVFAGATLVALGCARLRVAPEDGIVVDIQSPD